MNRIQTTLDALMMAERKAFISYVMAGDPDQDATISFMHELVSSGTDIIELGVPFSDPSADGPVIQKAHQRSVDGKTGFQEVFDTVSEFRKKDQNTPIVLMTYANPIEWMGYREFCQRAVEAGVDGTLIVDIPPEEAGEINAMLTEFDLYNVFLLAPTTTSARIKTICDFASGFLYYVSLKGVTGSADIAVDEVAEKLTEIRSYTDLPVCVGFGIKDAITAKAVAQVADGVVVGSAFVDLVAKHSAEQATQGIGQLAKGIREALDQGQD